MDLIDRYTYAVTKLLPASQRKEVEDELRSNIQDMVDVETGTSDERVRTVLKTLGRPEVLAMRYSDTKQYLIGPSWWAPYMRALKAIVTVATLVALLIATSSHWSTDESILGKVIGVILGTANGTILATFGVTIIFVFFEHSKPHESRQDAVLAWSVDDLPQLPAKQRSHKH
jgi:hypothetical protein